MKDYYKILGLEKTASKDEIKKAFHKLAHQYHPDKKNGDEAKFKEINEAYQVLSDDSKRAQYDQFGAYTGNMGGGGAGGFNANGGGFDFSGFQNGQGFDFDLGDIFGDIFGGSRNSRRSKRGRDISVEVEISFYDSIFGAEREISLSKVSTCEHCNGSGGEPGTNFKTCDTCKGAGKITETKRSILGAFSSVRECPTCHGAGKIPEKKCSVCHGDGVVKKSEKINLVIPAGIENGEMLRVTGKGEALAGGQTGDLYVRVYVAPDQKFTRQGLNLETTLDIKLTEALLGAEHKLKTLDGELEVMIPAGISSGEILRVRGKGVPTGRGGKRGDLLIKVIIKTPAKLSKQAKKLIEELKEEGI